MNTTKNYEVTMAETAYVTYLIKAKDEEQAAELVLMGNGKKIKTDEDEVETTIIDVEEIGGSI